MTLLRDPKVFTYVIMALYAMNAARLAGGKEYALACYWISALSLTIIVTFFLKH